MLTREAVEGLAGIHSDQFPIVSLYLNLPRDLSEGTEVIVLKNLLASVEEGKGRWKGEARASLERDLERIQRFAIDERIGGARALALFACHGLGLWEAHRSYLPVVNRIRVDREIYLKPLLRLFDRAGQYGLALVDKAHSRLFRVSVNGVEEVADLIDATPGRHDQGGWAQARFQRHHEDHVQRHLRRTVEELLRRHQGEPYQALFIGGPDPVIDQFRDLLHPYLKEILAEEELSLPVAAPHQQIHESVLEPILRIETAQGEHLLETLKAQSAQGNLGVAGLEPTLRALEQGQVRVLLVGNTFRQPGYRCPSCGHLQVEDEGRCPYCGEGLERAADVVADAVEKAFAQEAQVHFVSGDPRDRQDSLASVGHIGAILRYPIGGRS